MFNFIIKLLGGSTREENSSIEKIARNARIAQLTAEQQNMKLRRELSCANRQLEYSVPGSSIIAMEAYVKQTNARIEELEKALKIKSKKLENSKRILKLSSIKGGVS